MDVRVGIYLCTHMWVGVLSVACVGSMDIWSPQAVGVIGQALFLFMFFVLLKNRVVFRKSIALQSSYRLVWESRLLPLKMLVSCIICFKRIWDFHALKDLHEGTLHTQVHLVFLWCMVHIAIKITFHFLSARPLTLPDLCAVLGLLTFSFSSPLSSLKAELLSVWQNCDAIWKNWPGHSAWSLAAW